MRLRKKKKLLYFPNQITVWNCTNVNHKFQSKTVSLVNSLWIGLRTSCWIYYCCLSNVTWTWIWAAIGYSFVLVWVIKFDNYPGLSHLSSYVWQFYQFWPVLQLSLTVLPSRQIRDHNGWFMVWFWQLTLKATFPTLSLSHSHNLPPPLLSNQDPLLYCHPMVIVNDKNSPMVSFVSQIRVRHNDD